MGYLTGAHGERPRASRIVRVRRSGPKKLGPFDGKIRTVGEDAIFSVEISAATPVLRRGRRWSVQHRSSGQRVREISYHSLDGAKFQGPSMGIKIEGKPPFYLGIAEVASAHALDGSVILRATISAPESRRKSVQGAVHYADGRCQSIGRAVADCRENGRASKAARPLEASFAHDPMRTPLRHRFSFGEAQTLVMAAL